MITLQEAIAIVLESSQQSAKSEVIPLWDGLNRVVSNDIFSDINMPPFEKTAVDGYACRMQDVTGVLEVVEVIPAGKVPEKKITTGRCAKIMTGAMVPEGADCVLMVEETKEVSSDRIIFTGKYPKPNICRLGEDIKTGDLAIARGTVIGSQHIAIMASVGCAKPVVAVRPKVAVLTTGDELVEPEVKPVIGQIRNSNGHQLIAQVTRTGAVPLYYGIISDAREITRKSLEKAMNDNDIVILTGGVSMGDFDYVPEVMKELGIEIRFKSIAVQPGKPTTFGTKGDKLIFGLPGNPVSSYLQFELLVKPAILKMMGVTSPANTLCLPMGKDYNRKKTERLGLVPVAITGYNKVEPVDFHGSAHIFALAKANGFIMIPIGTAQLKEGEYVDVRPF